MFCRHKPILNFMWQGKETRTKTIFEKNKIGGITLPLT